MSTPRPDSPDDYPIVSSPRPGSPIEFGFKPTKRPSLWRRLKTYISDRIPTRSKYIYYDNCTYFCVIFVFIFKCQINSLILLLLEANPIYSFTIIYLNHYLNPYLT